MEANNSVLLSTNGLQIKIKKIKNVNAHIKNQFWNLELVQLYGSSPAETCDKLLEKRLGLFGLNLHEIIVHYDGRYNFA